MAGPGGRPFAAARSGTLTRMDAAIDERLPALARRWAAYWPRDDAAAMAADVRARSAAAVAAWSLDGVEALPGGEVALVLAGRRAGRPVVLKVHARGHAETTALAAEGEALAFWQATGAVPALEDRRDDGLTLLLERVVPGTPLDDTGASWDERLEVLGALVAGLHAAGLPPGPFPHTDGYDPAWRTALAGDPAEHALLADLLRPGARDVLLHADLHRANALRDAAGGWRAIDPHAVIGDRHADVWALIDPLAPPLPDDPGAARAQARARVERYAAAAGLDPGRAAAWVRVRARREARGIEALAAPDAEERAWRDRLHRMADALAAEIV